MNKELSVLKTVYDAIEDKFGKDTLILDVSQVSAFCDYFVITNGTNISQLRAIADNVEEELFKAGIKLNHSEGYQSANWILLDFGHIIVHIFDEKNREFYDLERIWGDAPKVILE